MAIRFVKNRSEPVERALMAKRFKAAVYDRRDGLFRSDGPDIDWICEPEHKKPVLTPPLQLWISVILNLEQEKTMFGPKERSRKQANFWQSGSHGLFSKIQKMEDAEFEKFASDPQNGPLLDEFEVYRQNLLHLIAIALVALFIFSVLMGLFFAA